MGKKIPIQCYTAQIDTYIAIRHEVNLKKAFTQNVKAEVMGRFRIIIKSPNKM